MTIKSLFTGLYNSCIRQEADLTNGLMIVHLKRHRFENSWIDCTEEEFQKLLHICRQIAKEQPDILSVDENVFYDDPLTKEIGKHYFAEESHWNEEKIQSLISKYFPTE